MVYPRMGSANRLRAWCAGREVAEAKEAKAEAIVEAEKKGDEGIADAKDEKSVAEDKASWLLGRPSARICRPSQFRNAFVSQGVSVRQYGLLRRPHCQYSRHNARRHEHHKHHQKHIKHHSKPFETPPGPPFATPRAGGGCCRGGCGGEGREGGREGRPCGGSGRARGGAGDSPGKLPPRSLRRVRSGLPPSLRLYKLVQPGI